MSAILISSFAKQCEESTNIIELDPSLLERVSGGCGCKGKSVTKTDSGDGKVTYTVDEDRTT